MEDVAFAGIHEVRRQNLLLLIAEAGSIKALGERMRAAMQSSDPDAAGKDYANTLSQYKTIKTMGPGFARDLEVSMGKPKNWMDVLHPDAAENAVEGREAAQIVMGNEAAPRDAGATPKGP